MMRHILTAILWVLGAAISHLPGADLFSAARPNVLLIHFDQVRIDAWGAYGNTQIKTPAIDQLAADGVRFRNSFCSFPVCTPSRYSLLSGLPVHVHRGWNNHCTLPPHRTEIAEWYTRQMQQWRATNKINK